MRGSLDSRLTNNPSSRPFSRREWAKGMAQRHSPRLRRKGLIHYWWRKGWGDSNTLAHLTLHFPLFIQHWYYFTSLPALKLLHRTCAVVLLETSICPSHSSSKLRQRESMSSQQACKCINILSVTAAISSCSVYPALSWLAAPPGPLTLLTTSV